VETHESPKSSPWVSFVLIVGIVVLVFGVALGPMSPGGIKKAPQSASVQMAHAIGLALYSYANDNNQQYPDGASSTEVFQKLMNGGYVTDPSIFYIPMPGKVKAEAGQKLKHENVCWDVTAPVDTSGPPRDLPVLFLTGYRINYVPGGAAIPVIKPFPRFWKDESGVGQWVGIMSYKASEGIAAFYENNSASFHNVDADHTIPNFVPPDFKPDGKTYRQLTPDGVLK
jgi:hypothetical protein